MTSYQQVPGDRWHKPYSTVAAKPTLMGPWAGSPPMPALDWTCTVKGKRKGPCHPVLPSFSCHTDCTHSDSARGEVVTELQES